MSDGLENLFFFWPLESIYRSFVWRIFDIWFLYHKNLFAVYLSYKLQLSVFCRKNLFVVLLYDELGYLKKFFTVKDVFIVFLSDKSISWKSICVVFIQPTFSIGVFHCENPFIHVYVRNTSNLWLLLWKPVMCNFLCYKLKISYFCEKLFVDFFFVRQTSIIGISYHEIHLSYFYPKDIDYQIFLL